MFYTIYKITNTKDGKEYIGKHQTKDLDDGYMGSGKHLKRAIEKYGVENFRKEILHVFDTEDEMNAKEAKIVTEEYCARDDTYNLCPGGHGGWGYINGNKELRVAKNKKAAKIANEKGAYIKGGQKVKEVYPEGVFKGCKHDEQTRKKISERVKASGDKLKPWQGTFWITNGVNNKRIKGGIPEGWRKGRTIAE